MPKDMLRESASARAALALEAGQMGSFVWSTTSGVATGDDAVCELFGIEQTDDLRPAEDFLGRVHPEDRMIVEDAANTAIETCGDYTADFRVADRSGGWRWISGRGRVIDLETDDPKVVGINWDISHRKLREEELSVLAGEMKHRVNNAFAVTQSLLAMAGKSAETVDDLVMTLSAQLEAMAEGHRLSERSGENPTDSSVPMMTIVRMALAAWLTDEGGPVTLEEKGACLVSSEQITNCAMMFYELTTNSVKYGALGSSGGALTVSIDTVSESEHRLIWLEDVPERPDFDSSKGKQGTGFGSKLLKHCMHSLGGEFEREVTENSFRFEMTWPRH
ncbi:Histidine kinase [Altererythrobacter insulae]|nr:Histidine kinase [Altererythrobacter insulae]